MCVAQNAACLHVHLDKHLSTHANTHTHTNTHTQTTLLPFLYDGDITNNLSSLHQTSLENESLTTKDIKDITINKHVHDNTHTHTHTLLALKNLSVATHTSVSIPIRIISSVGREGCSQERQTRRYCSLYKHITHTHAHTQAIHTYLYLLAQ